MERAIASLRDIPMTSVSFLKSKLRKSSEQGWAYALLTKMNVDVVPQFLNTAERHVVPAEKEIRPRVIPLTKRKAKCQGLSNWQYLEYLHSSRFA